MILPEDELRNEAMRITVMGATGRTGERTAELLLLFQGKGVVR
jgi:hypothetical protein